MSAAAAPQEFVLPGHERPAREWETSESDVVAARALAWLHGNTSSATSSAAPDDPEPVACSPPPWPEVFSPGASTPPRHPRNRPSGKTPRRERQRRQLVRKTKSEPCVRVTMGNCVCRKSRCLKLYCVCFAAGSACASTCLCSGCANASGGADREAEVARRLLENGRAFQSKLRGADSGTGAHHVSGCKCKNSSCLKNYCECFQLGVPCSDRCRCLNCANTGGASHSHNAETTQQEETPEASDASGSDEPEEQDEPEEPEEAPAEFPKKKKIFS